MATVGQVLQDATRPDRNARTLYGTIVHVNSSTVDIVLDNRGGLLQRKKFTGTPRVGERVSITVVDQVMMVNCPVR